MRPSVRNAIAGAGMTVVALGAMSAFEMEPAFAHDATVTSFCGKTGPEIDVVLTNMGDATGTLKIAIDGKAVDSEPADKLGAGAERTFDAITGNHTVETSWGYFDKGVVKDKTSLFNISVEKCPESSTTTTTTKATTTTSTPATTTTTKPTLAMTGSNDTGNYLLTGVELISFGTLALLATSMIAHKYQKSQLNSSK